MEKHGWSLKSIVRNLVVVAQAQRACAAIVDLTFNLAAPRLGQTLNRVFLALNNRALELVWQQNPGVQQMPARG